MAEVTMDMKVSFGLELFPENKSKLLIQLLRS